MKTNVTATNPYQNTPWQKPNMMKLRRHWQPKYILRAKQSALNPLRLYINTYLHRNREGKLKWKVKVQNTVPTISSVHTGCYWSKSGGLGMEWRGKGKAQGGGDGGAFLRACALQEFVVVWSFCFGWQQNKLISDADKIRKASNIEYTLSNLCQSR